MYTPAELLHHHMIQIESLEVSIPMDLLLGKLTSAVLLLLLVLLLCILLRQCNKDLL